MRLLLLLGFGLACFILEMQAYWVDWEYYNLILFPINVEDAIQTAHFVDN